MNLEDFKKDFNIEANKVLANFGINLNKDSDNDGVQDSKDIKPTDFNNFSIAEQKEIFGASYNNTDKIKDFFGIAPGDTDNDGVPDSYEKNNNMLPSDPDSDHDGIYDGEEIVKSLNPINADQDKDGVLDGRDAYPLDANRSVLENDKDTDGDGVGDRFESYIKSNIYVKDTDSDGLSDAVDENILINYKFSKKINSNTNNNDLQFGVQNNFLSFFADVLYILIFIATLFFVFIFRKWFSQISSDVEHYYHMFHNAYGFKHDDKHGNTHHENFKNIKQDVKNINADNNLREINHESHTKINDYKILEKDILKREVFKSVIVDGEKRWEIVSTYMSENISDMWKLGIIEADSMLDEALKNAGYMGVSMGDRLKSANFRSIDMAWDAHKMRNKIAHEGLSFEFSEREARKTFIMYETVLKDLKVI